MATKIARMNGPHSAGIFADMTIDGPEIGTLVLIVDRAKNLPNKKTMGKQNPYCAARLGKDAQKTETDKRGGQTPRWDQELRFTVHDSPDYYNLKISVFSEDKRTDLVGEAWVSLNDVIVPGGGKNDLWQGLTCKGKYAGELRIELTYYDSRQKPDKTAEPATAEEDTRPDLSSSKVKRRPLPQNSNIPSTTPVVIPERPLPGRARHGPRDFHIPQRPSSMPPQDLSYPHSQTTLMVQKPIKEALTSSSAPSIEHIPSQQHFEEAQHVLQVDSLMPTQTHVPQPPDFLPEHGPSSRRTSAMAPQLPEPMQATAQAPVHRGLPPQSYGAAIPHSHSAPSVPMARPDHRGYEDIYQPETEYQERPRTEQYYRHDLSRTGNVPASWDHDRNDPYSDKQVYAEGNNLAPPPPPIHSNSAPAVPHYSPQHIQLQHPSRHEATPPRLSQQYVPDMSPLQSIERSHGLPQQVPHNEQQQHESSSSSPHHYHHHHPTREHPTDKYDLSTAHHGYIGTTPDASPIQMSSPYDRSSQSQHFPPSHSVTESYTGILRPHPLSQEIPRNRVHDPYRGAEQPSSSARSYGREPRERRSWVQDAPPLIKPRAISPNQLPVSSAMQSQQTAPSYHPPQPLQEQQPQSKAYKPRNPYSIQFPVRAFESSDESPLTVARNPPSNAVPTRKSVSPRPSMSGNGPSATPFSPDSFDVHNPTYQVQPGSNEIPASAHSGPIVDWDGNEIHPSDHLPVDSWAPEPEQKVPNKTYGLGRDRDFGPRAPQGVPTNTGRISKDTIINIRRKKQEEKPAPMPASAAVRHGRLQKPRPDQGHAELPRGRGDYEREYHPYTQPQYSRSFTEDLAGMNPDRGYHHNGYGPPSIPPKLPIQPAPEYDQDALSREIATIDIGSSRNRLSQSAVAYVPVRSHRDRNSFY